MDNLKVSSLAGILGFSNYMELQALQDKLKGQHSKNLESNEDYSRAYLQTEKFMKSYSKKREEVNH